MTNFSFSSREPYSTVEHFNWLNSINDWNWGRGLAIFMLNPRTIIPGRKITRWEKRNRRKKVSNKIHVYAKAKLGNGKGIKRLGPNFLVIFHSHGDVYLSGGSGLFLTIWNYFGKEVWLTLSVLLGRNCTHLFRVICFDIFQSFSNPSLKQVNQAVIALVILDGGVSAAKHYKSKCY